MTELKSYISKSNKEALEEDKYNSRNQDKIDKSNSRDKEKSLS